MNKTGQKNLIYIKLTPRASSNAIGEKIENIDGIPVFKAKVTAIPEKGKANKALIALLAKALKCPKSEITIIKGETSRLKLVQLPIEADKIQSKHL